MGINTWDGLKGQAVLFLILSIEVFLRKLYYEIIGKENEMVRRLTILTLIVIGVALTGSLIWSFILNARHDTVLAVTAFSVSVVTFFGVIALNRPREGKWLVGKENLRSAIASCVVVTYVFILTFTTFAGSPNEMSELTQSYTEMLSNITGVTLAFYFTASAAVEIFGKKGSDEDEDGEEPENKKQKDELVKKKK